MTNPPPGAVMPKKSVNTKKNNGKSSEEPIEKQLWKAADKLRKNKVKLG